MNRTIKDATVKRYLYKTHTELRERFADYRRRLRFRTPAEDANF